MDMVIDGWNEAPPGKTADYKNIMTMLEARGVLKTDPNLCARIDFHRPGAGGRNRNTPKCSNYL